MYIVNVAKYAVIHNVIILKEKNMNVSTLNLNFVTPAEVSGQVNGNRYF